MTTTTAEERPKEQLLRTYTFDLLFRGYGV